MEDRTRRRRWGERNDGDTGWVEHRVAKTSQELSFKIHNSLFFFLQSPFYGFGRLEREERIGERRRGL